MFPEAWLKKEDFDVIDTVTEAGGPGWMTMGKKKASPDPGVPHSLLPGQSMNQAALAAKSPYVAWSYSYWCTPFFWTDIQNKLFLLQVAFCEVFTHSDGETSQHATKQSKGKTLTPARETGRLAADP